MKTIFLRSTLFAAITVSSLFLSACQNAPVARISAQRSLAFAASLEGAPDLMGGFVGREAISGVPTSAHGPDNAQLQRAQHDQRAYVIWKSSQKS